MVKPNVVKATKNLKSSTLAENGELRIIGGLWRGRKLKFTALPGLRPSPNRVRETLFNWLMPELTGAHCLDLFAGSGALGLEALSRGAACCWFIDTERGACREIQAHLAMLQCDAGRVSNTDTLAWLKSKPAVATKFHIVFLDPPFRQGLLNDCCAQLEQNGWLTDSALIYIESAADEPPPQVPSNWLAHRDKQAGRVAYRLFRRVAAQPVN